MNVTAGKLKKALFLVIVGATHWRWMMISAEGFVSSFQSPQYNFGRRLTRTNNLASKLEDADTDADADSTSTKPLPIAPALSMPVWSLAVPAADETAMNIVTFASPISVAPPKLWMISLYHNTRTKDSFIQSGQGVLQLLSPKQQKLVPLLGKQSGYEISKSSACESQQSAWVDNPFGPGQLLPGCAVYLHFVTDLQSADGAMLDAGDHVLLRCELKGTGVWDSQKQQVRIVDPENETLSPLDETQALYTGQLRREGVI